MSREALVELLAKVEAGEDADIVYGLADECIPEPLRPKVSNAYHGSLDAAKALHEAVLPGWEYCFDSESGATAYNRNKVPFAMIDGDVKDPARAWLIAILKALIAEAEE